MDNNQLNFNRDENSIYVLDNKDFNVRIAEIDFRIVEEGTIEVYRTFVDESLRGMGVANKLVEELIIYMKENNLKCIPICSYVVKWFEKHENMSYLLK